MISEAVEIRRNYHGSRDGEGRNNSGGSETVGRKVLPSEFTMLKKGGAQNDFMTSAIVYQTVLPLVRITASRGCARSSDSRFPA